MQLNNPHDSNSHKVITAWPIAQLRLLRKTDSGLAICVRTGGLLQLIDGIDECREAVKDNPDSQLLAICTEPHRSRLTFLTSVKESSGETKAISLVLEVSWRLDVREFVRQRDRSIQDPEGRWSRRSVDSLLDPVGLDHPMSKRNIEILLAMLCQQEMLIACHSMTVEELVDKPGKSHQAWQNILDTVLASYGVHVTLCDSALHEINKSEYARAQEQRRQLIERSNRERCEEELTELETKLNLSAEERKIQASAVRERYDRRSKEQCTEAGLPVVPFAVESAQPVSRIWRAVELPAAIAVYFALLVPTPLVVFLLWQRREFCRYVSRGNGCVWFLGGCAALVLWLCKLPFSFARFAWPRAPYCGAGVSNPKSLLLAYGPARTQLNRGLRYGVACAARRWADAVLSIAAVPYSLVGRYNFKVHEAEPKGDRGLESGGPQPSEFSQEGIRSHSVLSRLGAVVVCAVVWGTVLLTYLCVRALRY